ncbi:MAG: hypothetical protein Q7S51_04475, partial [Gallionellaceae bacterium]|nr:hypothetical protein [Gallionellaceae bacterium]
RYGVGYDRNTWNTTEGAGNANSGLQGNYSTTFDKQTFGLDARRTEAVWALGSSDLRSNNITGRHTYRPDPLFSAASSASIEQSNIRSGNNTINSSEFHNRYLQANTNANWQPDPELPFFVNSGVRINDSVSDANGISSTSQSQNLNAGVSYDHTRNLRFYLDGTLTNSKNDGIPNRTLTENFRSNYQSDTIKFGDSSYNWGANGGMRHQSNTTSPSNQAITGGAGHRLSTPYALGGGASLNLSVSQDFLAENDRLAGQNRTLSHTGGLTWRPASRGTLSGSVSGSVSDVRTIGGATPMHNQAASLGAEAVNRISANANMRANATQQWSKNETGQVSTSAYANLTYQHTRAFDVQNLRYALTYMMNRTQSRNPNWQSIQPAVSSSALDQSLDYRIGRANVRLTVAIAQYGQATSNSIMLHLGRSFGNL